MSEALPPQSRRRRRHLPSRGRAGGGARRGRGSWPGSGSASALRLQPLAPTGREPDPDPGPRLPDPPDSLARLFPASVESYALPPPKKKKPSRTRGISCPSGTGGGAGLESSKRVEEGSCFSMGPNPPRPRAPPPPSWDEPHLTQWASS